MNRITISRPTAPAMRLLVTDCWPRLALTSVVDTVPISAGSAPALIALARPLAVAVVKLPVICVVLVWPPLITLGAVSTLLSRKMATFAVAGGLELLVWYAAKAAVVI